MPPPHTCLDSMRDAPPTHPCLNSMRDAPPHAHTCLDSMRDALHANTLLTVRMRYSGSMHASGSISEMIGARYSWGGRGKGRWGLQGPAGWLAVVAGFTGASRLAGCSTLFSAEIHGAHSWP